MSVHNEQMPSNGPSISVVIPAYGPSPHLEDVLDALTGAADQPEQIFVSHSGDGDPTGRLKASHPEIIIMHSPERLFAGAARNRAAKAATGDVIAFCDNDTVPADEWAANIRKHFKAGGLVLVGAVDVCRTGGYWGMSTWLCEFSEQAPWGKLREQKGGASCNMAVLRSDLAKVGYFPEDFRAGQDTMLLHNLRQAGLQQIFDPELRVGHFNISGFSHFRRHLFNQGRHFAKIRRAVPMSGHIAVRLPPLAPLLGIAKAALILRRMLASRRPGLVVKYLPGVLTGVMVWTAGVTYAAFTKNFTGTY